MARNKGTFQFAANFEIKAAAALDPRVVVSTKAELITKDTWPCDGDTIYLYKGILVAVQEEDAIYMLTDTSKILSSDYSGWLRVDAGNAEQVEVVDNLTSDDTNKALSAKQGKVLMGEITGVKNKISSIYKYKGSVYTYDNLPENAEAGDVYNVEEPYEGHPSGTNWAWTGTIWDALAGSIDLSSYYTAVEVKNLIKEETDARVLAEQGLTKSISDVNTIATEAKTLANTNNTDISRLSIAITDINLALSGNEDDQTDGIVGRLATVEEKNTAQDTRLTNLEKLVSGGEAGDDGTTLLEMVNANTAAIASLEPRVKANEDAITLLNNNAQTVGSVDYKIDQAFAWVNVE